MKEFDLRKNNGGRREGAGRKKLDHDSKRSEVIWVYILPEKKRKILAKYGKIKLSDYINRLIDKDLE